MSYNVLGVGVVRPHELSAGSWRPMLEAYTLVQVGGTVVDPVLEWALVASWAAPNEPVPAPALVRGISFIPPDARVTWSSVTSTTDSRYEYRVRVRWYVNGLLHATETAPQITGQTDLRTFTNGSSVYARLQYYNDRGNGPEVQTATLNL